MVDLSLTRLHAANAYCRFSCHLELCHYQFLTSQMSTSNLFPTWVNGSSSSVLDAFTRLDQYKRQLLSGVLCINMDLQGSFRTNPVSPDESPPSGLGCLPHAADGGEAISSGSIRSVWQVSAAEAKDPGTVFCSSSRHFNLISPVGKGLITFTPVCKYLEWCLTLESVCSCCEIRQTCRQRMSIGYRRAFKVNTCANAVMYKLESQDVTKRSACLKLQG